MKDTRWVAVSGGFDPLHIGHVRLLRAAAKLGDKLVVILNNDNWLRDKKGFAFMSARERAEVLRAFPFVDRVVVTSHKPSDPKDAYHRGVSRELLKLEPEIFANGGDRDKKDARDPNSSLYWDIKTCKKHRIKMIFNVGEGGKIQSSSRLVDAARRPASSTVRPWGRYYGWDGGKGWNLKTIYIKAGKRLSLQYHRRREEWWLLVSGDAQATFQDRSGERIVPLKKGEVLRVGKRQVHRLSSRRGGVVVEVAYGDFDENDIVRVEDDFGRVRKSA